MPLLQQTSTRAPANFDKKITKEKTKQMLEELDALQNVLYAEGKHSILVILQGMDASGKDGAIKNVFGQLNPMGVQVKSFEVPTEEEMKHDFLWRVHAHAPAKGMIQIFNRSQYEHVLVTRVHGWCTNEQALKSFDAINNFERLLLDHNNTTIFKFYLHIPQEQHVRLKERTEDPTKHWKYNKKDKDEAKLWDKYMQMYEDVFERCNVIPWNIVPADQNWYKEYIITKTVVDSLKALNMQYPDLKE